MITAKGNDVKTNIKKGDLTAKDEYISLKEGQGIKVRVLSAEDFVEYNSHGAYNLDIFTQPCPHKDCVYCKAGKLGWDNESLADFKVLSAKQRYLFAFADMESGRVKLLDVSKNQAKKLMASIDKYAKNINTVAFTLDRVGSGKDTSYTLNPILGMEPAEQAQFDKFNGVSVDVDFFVERLEIRVSSEEFKVKMLKEAGFPIEAHATSLGEELVGKALATEDATPVEESAESII